MCKSLRPAVAAGLSALLAGCPAALRPPPPLPPLPGAQTRGATLYELEPGASQAQILVFRGGTLARLGHNHVVTVRDLRGRIWLHRQFERSDCELAFAVEALIVDDPQARRDAGRDFPPDIPQADKDGTRRNMLRAEVLDASNYPEISLLCARVAGTLQAPRLTVRITIRGVSRDLELPAAISLEAGRLVVAGEFDLLQSDFGIQPFSVALGALQVQDSLHIRYHIVAQGPP